MSRFFEELPPSVIAEADQAGAQIKEVVSYLVSAMAAIEPLPDADKPAAVLLFMETVLALPPNLTSAVVFQLTLMAAASKDGVTL